MVGRVRNETACCCFLVEDLGQAREERGCLPLVHVLGAVEDHDVVVLHDLQCHEDFLVLFCEVAKHELHVHFGALNDGLGAVHEAEEVSPLVLVGEGQDRDEDSEVVVF